MHNDKMHTEACASVSAEHQYLGMNKTSFMDCNMC